MPKGDVVAFSPPVTANKWTASSTGLDLAETLDFDEWCRLGAELARVEKGVQWWIGDWWIAGHRYGERAKAAAEGMFGRSFHTLRRCGTVARAFESDRRRSLLDFNHHAEVAAIPREEADELLDLAEAERWSTRDLRAEVYRRRARVGGLMNCGSVARAFETSRRREVLPFTHHAEVAARTHRYPRAKFAGGATGDVLGDAFGGDAA